MNVLIVGAGPTGLTAAVELARRGIVARVVDRRDAASPFSRAVGILPKSLELLTPSGVTARLLTEGVRFREAHIYQGRRRALTIRLRGAHPVYDFILALAQDRTEAHLRAAFEDAGGRVDYGVEFAGVVQDAEGVSASFADGSAMRADYVIGADGVRSTVRESLSIPYPGIDLPETWSIADVDAAGWRHPEAFSIFRAGGGQVAVVAPLDTGRYRVIADTGDALKTLPLPMNVSHIRREGRFQISVRQVERYQVGRIFLAGDAAHCHSPVGGRGMNLGIADAVDLARRLADGDSDGYSAARHAEGAATIALSERGRRLMTSRNPLVFLLVSVGLRAGALLPFLRRRLARTLLQG